MIFSGIRGGAAKRLKRNNPLLWPLVRACMPQLRKDTGSHVQHAYFAIEKAKERMALGESPGGRRDFMTYMMRKNRDGVKPITDAEIFANVPLLILAGSETTATTLSGFIFYLAQNTEAHRKVTEEVRNAFASEADINFQSAHRLRYLHACIEEALRIFPAVAELPHRKSPGDIIGGHWIPQGVSIIKPLHSYPLYSHRTLLISDYFRQLLQRTNGLHIVIRRTLSSQRHISLSAGSRHRTLIITVVLSETIRQSSSPLVLGRETA